MPARIAARMASALRPSSTSSRTELTPSLSAEYVDALSVGQYASLVDAIIDAYPRAPILLPLRATPPGNGRITPSICRIASTARSEEHTSELQSQSNLVCRLLLEKKNNTSPQRAVYQQSTHRT